MCAGTVFFQDTDVAAAERNGFETAEDPRRDALGVNIAQGAGIEPAAVSVKATTEEGLGFTGAKEGIAAHAVCTILRK